MKIEGSSNVDSIDYDPIEKTLKVVYRGGSEYWYQPVTATQHTLLMNSESKGSELRKLITNKHMFVTKRSSGTRTSVVGNSEKQQLSNNPDKQGTLEDLLQMSLNFHQMKE